jgi:hypothetical protein
MFQNPQEYNLEVCDNGTLIQILCFWTLSKHHIEEIQGICPHVSDSSDQSTQFGHPSHLDSVITAEVKKLQLCPM